MRCSLKAEQVDSSAQGIRFVADGEHFHFAYPGIHNVYNCLTAIWLGRYYQMTHEEIQRGLDAFKPSGNRMDIVRVREATVINDSYNANPDAMKAALDMLWDMGKSCRRLAVLGDMLEMGEMAESGHLEIGAYAAEKADVLIAVGPESKAYIKGAGASLADERCFWTADAESAGKLLRKLMAPGDVILIKASRGVHLEKTLKMIQD